MREGPRPSTGTALRVLHRPHGFVLCSRVLVSNPWVSTDVQVRVWRASEHDPRAGVPYGRWKARVLRIERPENHPVWADRNCWACSIMGIGIAVLRRPTQHVAESWRDPRYCTRGWYRANRSPRNGFELHTDN